jgi:hypothetical protein
MKTRTLLMLALMCGVAILVAGVAQLVRVERQRPATALTIGDRATVGDLEVTVLGVDARRGTLAVDVRLAGLVDDDVTASFSLVVPGDVLAPRAEGDGACGAVTVEPVECTLSFDVSESGGSARTLVVRRGDSQRRWVVTAG